MYDGKEIIKELKNIKAMLEEQHAEELRYMELMQASKVLKGEDCRYVN